MPSIKWERIMIGKKQSKVREWKEEDVMRCGEEKRLK
jgi:hypothetical protein